MVYINTSLKTKALADKAVPTITCTSSNVVQTVLTAFAQVPDVHVWYGPDTYMGRNLAQLFQSLAQLRWVKMGVSKGGRLGGCLSLMPVCVPGACGLYRLHGWWCACSRAARPCP